MVVRALEAEDRSAGLVKSAYRTIRILELLADSPRRLSLTEIQRQLGVPKSSLHNLLQTLVERGWLDTSEGGTMYGIGLRALRVGAAYLERDPLIEVAGPILVRVRNLLDETVHLARLDGKDIVYLASYESMHHLRTSSRIGRRLPAHATALGKVLLAARSPDEVDRIVPDPLLALTPDTIVDRAELKTELADARVRGYSIEEGQSTVGLGCIAVAIPGHEPETDAISCSVPLVRFMKDRHPVIVAALAEAAEEIAYIRRRVE